MINKKSFMLLYLECLYIYIYEIGMNFIKVYFNFMNSVYIVYEIYCIYILIWQKVFIVVFDWYSNGWNLFIVIYMEFSLFIMLFFN